MSICSNYNTVNILYTYMMFRRHDMIVKKEKKMCPIAHFEGACEQMSFFKLFCWGKKTVSHV